MKKHSALFSMFAVVLGLAFFCGSAFSRNATSGTGSATHPRQVVYLQIESAISPAQVDLVEDAVAHAVSINAGLLLIRLDTPGGLVDSMRKIVQSILNSPVPVAVWVGPSGARAASAGVFIVAASDIAAMSPQSTIGAASPVQAGGKEIDETMARKVKNDLMSLVRSVAGSHGRNVQWFEQAVDKAVSITAQEAVMDKVVEYIAPDIHDLLVQIGARGTTEKGVVLAFGPDGYQVQEYEPGLRYKLLSWLINPQIAYFLLLGGIAGLFFELTTPGAVLPGVLGGICLLLGLYAMAILPTSVSGLLLILFGLVLFLLEIKIVSYGMLSVAGIISLFIGSLILFKDQPGVQSLPISTVIVTVSGVSVLLIAGIYLATKAQMAPRYSGADAMVGLAGSVMQVRDGKGQVLVRGELWNFVEKDTPLKVGDTVVVTGMDSLCLIVDKPSSAPKDVSVSV
ncbi:MAG: NfeD family protein [Desulfovibrio sp.]|uniref:NfeD family protein n=1 Tax=Desulfovibrio sp. 7SRBS1 TaxID=3378064 RepID=UPI003B4259E2